MSEYSQLIQKEKEEALQVYREDDLRLQLDRKNAEETKSSRSYVRWFQRPAFAGISVLFIILLAWFSRQFILPPSPVSNEIDIKNTFVQLLSQHKTILDQSPSQRDMDSYESGIHEFQWSIKRVIFAIQRENAQDDDIAQNLSIVLHKSAFLLGVEKDRSGELNI
jgi:hypothetical protein